MQIFIGALLALLGGIGGAQEKSPELQIRETLRALPEALRGGATVIGFMAVGLYYPILNAAQSLK